MGCFASKDREGMNGEGAFDKTTRARGVGAIIKMR